MKYKINVIYWQLILQIIFLCINVNITCFQSNDDTQTLDLPFTLTEFKEDQSIPFSETAFVILVNVCLGKPFQCGTYKFSTHPSEVWVIQAEEGRGSSYLGTSGFSPYLSHSFSSKEVCHILNTNGGVKGQVSEDSIYLSFEMHSNLAYRYKNIQIDNFPFLLVYNKRKHRDGYYIGGLGFGYKYDISQYDELNSLGFSLLERLYAQGIIEQRIFSVNYRNNLIHIGNIPNIPIKKKTIKTCDLLQTSPEGEPNPKFQCTINAIYIDTEHLIPINSRVTFSLGSKYIQVNNEIFEFIKEYYLKTQIATGICKITVLYKVTFFECNDRFKIKELPILSVIIGKWNIKLKNEDLFYKNQLLIGKSNTKNKIVFGYPFMKQFLSVFNVERNSISFMTYS